jgi:hypothetical protein
VGCGRRAPKCELVRLAVVAEDGTGTQVIAIDRGRNQHGRGAYLCLGPREHVPARECLVRASRNDGLVRTLRCRAPMSHELVESLAGA